MDLGPLPWTEKELLRILPHRPPFLFVDGIESLEPDTSVAGYRTWSSHDARVRTPGGGSAVPACLLIECMAQVGAVLILSRPEHRGRIVYFMGIDRVRFRAPVRPGDRLDVRGRMTRLRSRIGTLSGSARVGGREVASGSMTFVLGDEAGPGR